MQLLFCFLFNFSVDYFIDSMIGGLFYKIAKYSEKCQKQDEKILVQILKIFIKAADPHN